MAYIYQDPNDPNNPQNQQPGGAPPALGQTTPPPTGAGGSLLGGGANASAAPIGGSASSTPTPSSSGWTNLRAYLDANKDQAPGFANQVAGQVTQQGQAAKDAVTGGIQGYNDTLSKSAPGDVNGIISSANADPAAFASDPNNVSKFNSLASGKFNDPGAFEGQPGYGDLATKADTGSNLKNLVASEGGQKELIKQFNPQETAGQSSLDQLLLSGVPGASDTLKGAAEPFANLRGMLNQGAMDANAARTKAMGDTAAAKDQINAQFVQPKTKELTDLESNINQRVSQGSAEQSTKDQQIKDLQNFVEGRSGSLSPDEMAAFGIGSSSGGDLDALKANTLSVLKSKFPSSQTNDQDALAIAREITAGGGSRDDFPQYLRETFDSMKGQYTPLYSLRQSPGQDWMQKYFGGTQASVGTPTAASVASPQEAAKILALQKLIAGMNPFLTEDQLGQAGSYTPASIGRYNPTIQNISDGPGTPLQFRPQLGLV